VPVCIVGPNVVEGIVREPYIPRSFGIQPEME
jgi:hypothetical protein